MGEKKGDGTPTANTLNLLTYMFVNARGFTLQELADKYDCSKQSILGYFKNINRSCFGQIKPLDIKRDREFLYMLEINKEVINMFEKRMRNLQTRQEQINKQARKNKEIKKKGNTKNQSAFALRDPKIKNKKYLKAEKAQKKKKR